MLIAGPTAEPGRQRYLLISLMVPDSKGLVIPLRNNNPTDQAAWFDAIWNNNWENEGGALPAYWTNPSFGNPNVLLPEQQAAWAQGSGGTTNCHCLIVKRIVQPKYTITVNNTAAGKYGFVAFDTPANIQFTVDPGPPVSSPEDVLAGRLVIFSYATNSTPPGTEAFRVNISENTAFNLQPGSP
jgi:hypothetical protein